MSACSRDIAVEVRAAAVMVLTMMLQVGNFFVTSKHYLHIQYLQGLGRDVFSVLQGTIRDVYRELKMVAATEKEDMVLAHVSLALEEIDNIVKSLFTPDNSIEKKIVVLTTSCSSRPCQRLSCSACSVCPGSSGISRSETRRSSSFRSDVM